MKYYYYIIDNLKHGPFTIEEIKTKRLLKNTLIWTEGMNDWVSANTINELKNILISEPPSIPKVINKPSVIKIKEKKTLVPKKSSKYDLTYEKENNITFIGITLLILFLAINFIFADVLYFESKGSYTQVLAYFGITLFIIRIIITVLVVKIATRQNRNSINWGWFAFFFPLISLIVIGLLKKLILSIELDSNLSNKERVTILMDKTEKLFLDKRYRECIEILNKVINLERKNYNAFRIRAISHYKSGNLDKSKIDFKILYTDDKFSSITNYYLGNIEISSFKREKAITFWNKALEYGNKKALSKLDLYNNFTGKYLLNNFETGKKLGNHIFEKTFYFKYLKGLAHIDNNELAENINTEIGLCNNGIIINISKVFKNYTISIAYYEVNDIVFNIDNNVIEINLIDKKNLKFEYNRNEDESEFLKRLCKMVFEKTNKISSAYKYFTD